MTAKAFASSGDLSEKAVSFAEIGPGLYAYTAQGDPNSGIIVGDDACMVIDAQATPAMAKDVIARVAQVTDKPIRYVVLSHYHAVRVLGASAYDAQGIVASDATYRLILERGQEDWDSEFGRFPRLFRDADSIPGLTWPNLTFEGDMSVFLGKREVKLIHLGAGHTAGDIVAWVPDAEVMFSGDLVEYHSACYCGDARFRQHALRHGGALRRSRPLAQGNLRSGARGDGPEIRELRHLRALSSLQRLPRLRRGLGDRPSGDLDGGTGPGDVGGIAGMNPSPCKGEGRLGRRPSEE